MAYSLLHYTKFLADKALKRQLLTYQDFADEFELKTLRSTTSPLNQVLKWSNNKGLPPLNAIVVKPEQCEPGYIESDTEKQQLIDSVFDYPWKNIFLNL